MTVRGQLRQVGTALPVQEPRTPLTSLPCARSRATARLGCCYGALFYTGGRPRRALGFLRSRPPRSCASTRLRLIPLAAQYASSSRAVSFCRSTTFTPSTQPSPYLLSCQRVQPHLRVLPTVVFYPTSLLAFVGINYYLSSPPSLGFFMTYLDLLTKFPLCAILWQLFGSISSLHRRRLSLWQLRR